MSGRDRLFNRDVLLLWQGQLVSQLGDAVYRIALGFWILTTTGSTALMGLVMAASAVPRVLLSPLTGVVADRASRKWILVASDAVAGLAVTLVGLAAFGGLLEVWMVFAAAVVIGVAGALFDPALTSALPDVAPPHKLGRANAAFSLLATGAAIVGNAIGGFLFQALGAALLFMVNGLSYLASAFSELFVRIPRIELPGERPSFFADLRAGFVLVWRHQGLRWLLLGTAVHNFFSTIVFVLVLPLFQQSERLGAASFGLLMSSLAAGAFGGFLLSSGREVAPAGRFRWFLRLSLLEAAALAILPWLPWLAAMMAVMAIAGLATSVANTLLTTALQLTIRAEMRGKAFGLQATLMMGLGAAAMAIGGVLAEFVSVALLISAAGAAMGLVILLLGMRASVRQVLASVPSEDSGCRDGSRAERG